MTTTNRDARRTAVLAAIDELLDALRAVETASSRLDAAAGALPDADAASGRHLATGMAASGAITTELRRSAERIRAGLAGLWGL